MRIQLFPKNNKVTLSIWATFWHRDLNNQLTGTRDATAIKVKSIEVDLSDINNVEDLWDISMEIK